MYFRPVQAMWAAFLRFTTIIRSNNNPRSRSSHLSPAHPTWLPSPSLRSRRPRPAGPRCLPDPLAASPGQPATPPPSRGTPGPQHEPRPAPLRGNCWEGKCGDGYISGTPNVALNMGGGGAKGRYGLNLTVELPLIKNLGPL